MQRRRSLLVPLAVVAVLAVAPAAASAATVANTNDSGPGSLRQAVLDAAPGETINLPAGTYKLTSGENQIEKPLTTPGPGPARRSSEARATSGHSGSSTPPRRPSRD